MLCAVDPSEEHAFAQAIPLAPQRVHVRLAHAALHARPWLSYNISEASMT